MNWGEYQKRRRSNKLPSLPASCTRRFWDCTTNERNRRRPSNWLSFNYLYAHRLRRISTHDHLRTAVLGAAIDVGRATLGHRTFQGCRTKRCRSASPSVALVARDIVPGEQKVQLRVEIVWRRREEYMLDLPPRITTVSLVPDPARGSRPSAEGPGV